MKIHFLSKVVVVIKLTLLSITVFSQNKIFPDKPLDVSTFGNSVFIDGEYAAITSSNSKNSPFFNNYWRIYLFKKQGNEWIQKDSLEEGSFPKTTDDLGTSDISFKKGLLINKIKIKVGDNYIYDALNTYSYDQDSFIKEDILVFADTNYSYISFFELSGNFLVCRFTTHQHFEFHSIIIIKDLFYERMDKKWILKDSFMYKNHECNTSVFRTKMSDSTVILNTIDEKKEPVIFVYRLKNDHWTLIQKIKEMAISLAISPNNEFISIGNNEKAILMYRLSGTEYKFYSKIIEPSTDTLLHFGNSIAMKNNVLFVGHYDFDPLKHKGQVIQYIFNGKEWLMTKIIKPEQPDTLYGHFGESIDISRQKLIVGADYDKTYKKFGGAAYIFLGSPCCGVDLITICEGDEYDFFGQKITESGTYSYSYKTKDGIDSIVNLNLQVNQTQYIQIDTVLCKGLTLTFKDTVFDKTGNYFLKFPNFAGCIDSAAIKVQVEDFNIESTSTPDYGCANGSLKIVIIGIDPPYDLTWTDGFKGFELDPVPYGKYYGTVKSANNCYYNFEYQVNKIENEYHIPEAFIPDSPDEESKTFRVFPVSDSLKIKSVSIFDRWGEKVFYTEENIPWNGYYRGELLPPETYLYKIVIKSPCGEINENGQVIMLR